MTRIVAPSRLHFGLFHVPAWGDSDEGNVRRFGGVGLMIEQPGTVVSVRQSEAWQVEGPLASRAQVFAQRFLASLPEPHGAFQILVERCPPEHVGLGVGTQLGLAIAKALAMEVGAEEMTASELAGRLGRGERSAVGVHGFAHGGLIAEAGKLPHEAVSPLLNTIDLPASWRVVVAIPPVSSRWHGERERQAFAKVDRHDSLIQAALFELLPAARSGDLAAFGEVLHDFNRRAGEPFAKEQGGTYASPEVANLVAWLRGIGIAGVGQSSWGPAVFAIVGSEPEALQVVGRLRAYSPSTQAFATRVSAGAILEAGES